MDVNQIYVNMKGDYKRKIVIFDSPLRRVYTDSEMETHLLSKITDESDKNVIISFYSHLIVDDKEGEWSLNEWIFREKGENCKRFIEEQVLPIFSKYSISYDPQIIGICLSDF